MEYCPGHSGHEARIHASERCIEALQATTSAMALNLQRLTDIEQDNQRSLRAMDERVSALEDVPAARWNSLVGVLVTAAVSFLLGIVATRLGVSL